MKKVGKMKSAILSTFNVQLSTNQTVTHGSQKFISAQFNHSILSEDWGLDFWSLEFFLDWEFGAWGFAPALTHTQRPAVPAPKCPVEIPSRKIKPN